MEYISENLGHVAASVFVNAVEFDFSETAVHCWMDIEFEECYFENLTYSDQLRAIKTLSKPVVLPEGLAEDLIEGYVIKHRKEKGLPL